MRTDGDAGRVWARELALAVGWSEGLLDERPLGCVSFEIPVLIASDPSRLGVWRSSTLCAAPLAAFARWLGPAGGAEDLGRALFGDGLEESLWMDAAKARSMRERWLSERRPGGAAEPERIPGHVGAHMGLGHFMRNEANYMAAHPGELVGLDAMRGSKALLCASFRFRVARESEFEPVQSRAFAALESMLAPAPLFHRCAGGAVDVPGCGAPGELGRAASQCVAAWAAEDEARALSEAAGPGRTGGAAAPRI